eukprot:m.281166 g.281166  ORF g.281166 m.281166 type:complete len:120 (-) comp15751_c6_seq6:131-490(-)
MHPLPLLLLLLHPSPPCMIMLMMYRCVVVCSHVLHCCQNDVVTCCGTDLAHTHAHSLALFTFDGFVWRLNILSPWHYACVSVIVLLIVLYTIVHTTLSFVFLSILIPPCTFVQPLTCTR